MKIGALAKHSGLAASKIRFYESFGLLPGVKRHANGYREYTDEVLARLAIISSAQQTGFSLEEIKRLLSANIANGGHDEVTTAIHQKIASIDAMQVQLALNKTQLQTLLRIIADKPEGLDCHGNAQRIYQTVLNSQ